MVKKIPDSVRFFVIAMRRRRKELGLTQQNIADRAGLALATINQIEGFKRAGTEIASLEKIASALDDSFDNLVWLGKSMEADDVGAFRRRIGKTVERLRLARGLSRNALAIRAEIAPSYLAAVEAGASSPTIDKIYLICRVLNVQPEELFSGSKEEKL